MKIDVNKLKEELIILNDKFSISGIVQSDNVNENILYVHNIINSEYIRTHIYNLSTNLYIYMDTAGAYYQENLIKHILHHQVYYAHPIIKVTSKLTKI